MSATITHIRAISDIAAEVRHDWARPYFAARPYLEAMSCLDSIDDTYGHDDARGILSYFLSNATSWKGETARRVKAEIRTMLGLKVEPYRSKSRKVRT